MIRKLSMILLKFHSLLSTIRGETLKIIERPCPEEKQYIDTFHLDEETGIETKVRCGKVEAERHAKEKKRY